MREACNYSDVKGDVAYLAGMIMANMEHHLDPVLAQYTSFDCDVFCLADEEDRPIPLDKAVHDQVKGYLGIQDYPRHDDFNFSADGMEDLLLRQYGDVLDYPKPSEELSYFFADRQNIQLEMALYSFLGNFTIKEKVWEALRDFLRECHWIFQGFPKRVLHVDRDTVRQLEECQHYQYLVFDGIFLDFGEYVVLLTVGCNE